MSLSQDCQLPVRLFPFLSNLGVELIGISMLKMVKKRRTLRLALGLFLVQLCVQIYLWKVRWFNYVFSGCPITGICYSKISPRGLAE